VISAEPKLFDRTYQTFNELEQRTTYHREGTDLMNVNEIHAELLDMTEAFMEETHEYAPVSTATERRFKQLYDALNAAGVANLEAYKETLLTMGYMGYNRYSPGSYAIMRMDAEEHEKEPN
jgi:hypothetical protein